MSCSSNNYNNTAICFPGDSAKDRKTKSLRRMTKNVSRIFEQETILNDIEVLVKFRMRKVRSFRQYRLCSTSQRSTTSIRGRCLRRLCAMGKIHINACPGSPSTSTRSTKFFSDSRLKRNFQVSDSFSNSIEFISFHSKLYTKVNCH